MASRRCSTPATTRAGTWKRRTNRSCCAPPAQRHAAASRLKTPASCTVCQRGDCVGWDGPPPLAPSPVGEGERGPRAVALGRLLAGSGVVLHRKGDALAGGVYLQDGHFHLLVDFDHLVRVFDEAVGQLADVDE